MKHVGERISLPWLFGGRRFAAALLTEVMVIILPAATSNPPGPFGIKFKSPTLLFRGIGPSYYWPKVRRNYNMQPCHLAERMGSSWLQADLGEVETRGASPPFTLSREISWET